MLFIVLNPVYAIDVNRPITVSKKQVGDLWPFLREEVMLECRKGELLFAINPNSLVSYPLNKAAEENSFGSATVQPIDTILRDDAIALGKKMDYSKITKKALTLCK